MDTYAIVRAVKDIEATKRLIAETASDNLDVSIALEKLKQEVRCLSASNELLRIKQAEIWQRLGNLLFVLPTFTFVGVVVLTYILHLIGV